MCAKPITLVPDQGGMLENIRAGIEVVMEKEPDVDKVLAVSSDIPSINSEMVDWMVDRVQETDHDVYYNVIQRHVMEKRFPSSRRSFIRLKDIEICGGDLNALRASSVMDDRALYRRLVESRKNPLRQAGLLGYDTLLFLLLQKLTLSEAEQTVSKRMGILGRAILCPYAEIGMDVDKPIQFDMLRADLARPKLPLGH